MADERHLVDKVLRKVAGRPEPTASETTVARVRLEAAMRQPLEESRQPSRRLAGVVAAVLVVVVGAVVVIQPWRVSPASATLEEVAVLAEGVDPLLVPDGSFVYTKSRAVVMAEVPREGLGDTEFDADSLLYYSNTIRETWFGTSDTVQIAVTVLEPTFLRPEDESVYYMAGLDIQDQVGETLVTTIVQPDETVWPIDPQELDDAIRSEMADGRGIDAAFEYLDVALDILRESHASPELRASTLRLIGEIDDLQVVVSTPEEVSTFGLDYSDNGVAKELTFTVDSSGYLRFEQVVSIDGDASLGLPPGSIEYRIESNAPRVTSDLSPTQTSS